MPRLHTMPTMPRLPHTGRPPIYPPLGVTPILPINGYRSIPASIAGYMYWY